MINAVSPAVAVVIGIAGLVVGIVGGALLYKLIATKKLGKSKSNAVKIIEEAYAEAKAIKKEAVVESKEESLKLREQVENEVKERRSEAQKLGERLNQREEFIEKNAPDIED